MDRGRLLGGGALVALGVVLLAGQFGLIDAGSVVADWWPTVVIAAGVLRLVDRDTTAGVLYTVIGLVLLGWRLDVLDAQLWQWLAPGALIAVGGLLLLRRPRAPSKPDTGWTDDPMRSRSAVGPVVDAVAVLAGRELQAEAGPFRGGSAVAILGSVELDLTAATLGADGAELELTAILGSAELQVPDDWHVRIEGPAILGGIEDRTTPAPQGAPLLLVRATALLGGVEVTSRAPRRPPVAPRRPDRGPTGFAGDDVRDATTPPTA